MFLFLSLFKYILLVFEGLKHMVTVRTVYASESHRPITIQTRLASTTITRVLTRILTQFLSRGSRNRKPGTDSSSFHSRTEIKIYMKFWNQLLKYLYISFLNL